MWKFLANVSPPPSKKRKTNEEKLETQREYEQHRTRSFLPKWKTEFTWLQYDVVKNVMTCDICIKHETSGTFVTGCDNFKIQTIKKHSQSETHQKYVLSANAAKQSPGTSVGEKTLNKLNTSVIDKLSLLFRNAHYVAKAGRPYSDYKHLCKLDLAKGLEVGSTYLNDKYCAKFVSAIAETRKIEQDCILNEVPFLSIISDGATDTASKEAEIVLLRSSHEGQVYTHFIGIKNVPKADSFNIAGAIDNLLTSRFNETWKQKIIAMGTDGASVMLGNKSGVIQKIRELTGRPYIHAIHCSAHRLELAYKDAVKSLVTTTHKKCEALLLNLYLFYKYSPLNRANLITSYKSLGISTRIPTRVGGTRWLPHTRLALKNILYGYDAIVQHLEQIQNPCDPAHRKDSAAKGKNFLKLLQDDNVQFWLHLLLDVVVSLSMASEAIQQKGACLGDIYNELESVTLTLNKYKHSNGPYLKKLVAKSDKIGDGTLGNSRVSFLSSLVTAIKARFEGDLHLFKGSSFIEFKNWPSEMSSQIDYGDHDITEILPACKEALKAVEVDCEAIEPEWSRFKVDIYSTRKDVNSLTWKMLWNTMHLKYPNLFRLVQYLQTLPSSSVDAERGFSRMKMVKNDWRSRLGDQHLTDLILVNVETPDVTDFDPEPAVNHWNSSSVRQRRPFYMDEGKKKTSSDIEKLEEKSNEDLPLADGGQEELQELMFMAETFSDSDDDADDDEDYMLKADLIQLQNKAYKHMLNLM